MSDQADRQERSLERRYRIRQVTDHQASWTQGERGQAGTFTLQLILDKGVEEYILDVTSEDIDVILKLFKASDHVMFDLDRKVLMFETLSVD